MSRARVVVVIDAEHELRRMGFDDDEKQALEKAWSAALHGIARQLGVDDDVEWMPFGVGVVETSTPIEPERADGETWEGRLHRLAFDAIERLPNGAWRRRAVLGTGDGDWAEGGSRRERR